ncbi:MAG: hypothetical protein HYT76_00635 [Deltaproteobacteria bacterium]|nr:hypothetical protein [Deltaproteobacteria bacterium]
MGEVYSPIGTRLIEAVVASLPVPGVPASEKPVPIDRFVPAESASSATSRVQVEEEELDLKKVMAVAGIAVAGAAMIAGAYFLSKKVDTETIVTGLRSLFKGATHLHLERIVTPLVRWLPTAVATAAVAYLLQRVSSPDVFSDPSLEKFSLVSGRWSQQGRVSLFQKPIEIAPSTRPPALSPQKSTSSLGRSFPLAPQGKGIHILHTVRMVDAKIGRPIAIEQPRALTFQYPYRDRSGQILEADRPVATWILLTNRYLRGDSSPPPAPVRERRGEAVPPLLPMREDSLTPDGGDAETRVVLENSEREASPAGTREGLAPLFAKARNSYLMPYELSERGNGVSGALPPEAGFIPSLIQQQSLVLAASDLPGQDSPSVIPAPRGRTSLLKRKRVSLSGERRGEGKLLLEGGRSRGLFGSVEFSPLAPESSATYFCFTPQMQPRIVSFPMDTSALKPRGSDYSTQIEAVAQVLEYEIHAEEVSEDLPEVPEPEEAAEGQEQQGDHQDRRRDSEEEELTEVV